MKKLLRSCCLFLVCALIISLLPTSVFAAGTTYYVATTGSDTNEGTQAAPFQTISHAASLMTAGDTCIISGGTYYETISDKARALRGNANAPITFRAAAGETVTLSGAKEITGWTWSRGNIFVADMNWDMSYPISGLTEADYKGNGNMFFLDNKLTVEGRWPKLGMTTTEDVSVLLDIKRYAVADSGLGLFGDNTVRFTDAALSELSTHLTNYGLTDDDLTGARVWTMSGTAYWSYYNKIADYDSASNTISLENKGFAGTSYYPEAGDIYYITHHPYLLGEDGEWYKDIENGKLYMYFEGGEDPDGVRRVEAREREYVIQLTQSSYVNFEGINAHAGVVSFSGRTTNTSYKNAVAESMDIKMYPGCGNMGPFARGIVLEGSYNTVSGCEIKNNFGTGVSVGGSNNYVLNNYIHDINFEGSYADAVRLTGKEHMVSYNTITRTGRGTIGGTFQACEISYNDIYNSTLISEDSGVIYFDACDYDNSEIHHNIMHDCVNGPGTMQFGVYLDSLSTGLLFYNNLIYNVEKRLDKSDVGDSSFVINIHSHNNLFANNTFINTHSTDITCTPSRQAAPEQDLSGTVFVNNLFRYKAYASFATPELLESYNGITFTNNLEGTVKFPSSGTATPLDVWESDYTLKAGSAAIDQGIEIAGITDGYTGDAPDLGALEYGNDDWLNDVGYKSGRDVSSLTYGLNMQLPYRNRVQDRNYEALYTGDATNWQTTGSASVFRHAAYPDYGYLTKAGQYAVKLDGGDTVSQKLTGLKPNTNYVVGGYATVLGDYRNPTYNKTKMIAYDTAGNEIGDVGNVDGPMKVVGTSMLRFLNVDFRNGADTMIVGVLDSTSNTNKPQISIRLDSKTATPVATFTAYKYTNLERWWIEVPLDATYSGTHDVYFSFDSGDISSLTFYGFSPNKAATSEQVVLSATTDGADTDSVLFGTGMRERFDSANVIAATATSGWSHNNSFANLSKASYAVTNGALVLSQSGYSSENPGITWSAPASEQYSGLIEINFDYKATGSWNYLSGSNFLQLTNDSTESLLCVTTGGKLVLHSNSGKTVVDNSFYDGQQHHIRIIYNTDTGDYNVRLDEGTTGDSVLPNYYGTFSSATGNLKSLSFFMPRAGGASSVTIDNVSVKKLSTPMQTFTVKTGIGGEITLSATKTGDNSFGYVSYLSVKEANDGSGINNDEVYATQPFIWNIASNEPEQVTQFVPGQMNIFGAYVCNGTNADATMRGILALYDANDTLLNISHITHKVLPGEAGRFMLGAIVPPEATKAKLYAFTDIASVQPLIVPFEFSAQVLTQ